MSQEFDQSALDYHQYPVPGKLAIRATKPLANQRDLALAYSPGVAAACREIERDPLTAARYTSRSNLVAVITNGTAVLGLGAIGSLAAKPVMEGKAVLFKEFADIDVFDLEIEERDPQLLIETIARLEPSFGGINLEDIKAPDCFVVEQALRERLNIPVFHDDQHGTAIVVSAAIFNALRLTNKAIEDVRLVTSGAGASALACLDLLCTIGLRRENIMITDRSGVVHTGRITGLDIYKARYARDTSCRTLQEALVDADIFLGLSAAGVLKPEWLTTLAPQPIIMALANPVPEIMPEVAQQVRPDAIIATGRSDYPNQVNNVLCFPFIFRGALDCGAREINADMKMACVHALADLALQEPSEIVRAAYGGHELQFGPEYLIPKPFDPRLLATVAPAVALAAMTSGVATRPIADIANYRDTLKHRVYRTGMTMKPVFDQARRTLCRVVFAEGEQERVIQAAQQAVTEGIARPILIGRREVIMREARRLGLRITVDTDIEIVEPEHNPAFTTHCDAFYSCVSRHGYTPDEAREYVRTDPTVLAAIMTHCGDTQAMICGTIGRYSRHLKHVEEIIGTASGVGRLAALSAIVLHSGPLFIADSYVQHDPDAESLAEITQLCAMKVRRFGLKPRIALLSHSNFGSHDTASAQKMRHALQLLRELAPNLEVEGEMHANLALNAALRSARFPQSRLQDRANVLIMPNQDAANIAVNLLRELGGGTSIGPILLGAARPVHILSPSASVRGILNMTALAAAQASTPSALTTVV
jgi:malate dehydrogenase (oxaloacetate-decarboxylating)(NADP+)